MDEILLRYYGHAACMASDRFVEDVCGSVVEEILDHGSSMDASELLRA